jgi:sialidase-1
MTSRWIIHLGWLGYAILALAIPLISPNLNLSAQEAAGKVVLELNPTPDNPRNSEGAFVTLKSGRVLFLYTRFQGGSRDDSPAQIVRIHSDDEGRMWSPAPSLVVSNEASANVMSVSLLRLRSGGIALFYCVKKNLLDCHPVMRTSSDEADTWSAPVPVTTAPGYFVLNNDRVIQISSGRLILPVAFHRSRGVELTGRSWDSRAIALWYMSDDEGKSWTEAQDWWALPRHTRTGLQEPGVVQLGDGRLFSWMRTDQGAQFGSYSTNAGKSWSLPEATTLQSPESPCSIKHLPGSSDLLAVFNDHSGRFPFTKGKRSPLVAAISKDGGLTWPLRKAIETDQMGWYCYTAIHYTKDAILLAYCAGDAAVGPLNRLRIRRTSLEWVRELNRGL